MANEISKTPTQAKLQVIPLSKIHDLPNVFIAKPQDKSLGSMVLSIESSGVKEPVILRQRDDGEYQLLPGYRRRRASELAKKPEPPAPPPGVEFADVQKSDFPTSRRRKNPPQEVEETDPNQTKRNQLDFIQPDPSIYPPTPSGRQMGIDRCEVREEVKENIEYEHLRQELPYDDVESLLELIVDVLSSTASTIRIGGEVLPVDAVRRRFRQLDSEHIKYIIDSMSQTTTKINNIRAYLLTALYNAPITIGPYYSAAVRHDFG